MGGKKRAREDAGTDNSTRKRARVRGRPLATVQSAAAPDDQGPIIARDQLDGHFTGNHGKNSAVQSATRSARRKRVKSDLENSHPVSYDLSRGNTKAGTEESGNTMVNNGDIAHRKKRHKEDKKAPMSPQTAFRARIQYNKLAGNHQNVAGQPIEEVDVDTVDRNEAVDDDSHLYWTLSSPTGGRLIDQDPLFVEDENGLQHLISASACELQVLSVETSLTVRTLPVPPGVSVRCFAQDAIHSHLVHIAYTDGIIANWDWLSGSKTDTGAWTAQGDVITMEAVAVQGDNVVFYASHMHDHYAVCVGTQPLYVTTQSIHRIHVLSEAETVIASGLSCLVLGVLKSIEDGLPSYQWTEVPLPVRTASVDVRYTTSPTSNHKGVNRRTSISLAVGTSEGKIYLYEDITTIFNHIDHAALPAPRILHWHRESVNSVKFSRDGNYLISGGKETVLILWQLDTGKKQFLPHLTSEIERIVVNREGDRYAVQMGDNSIMVLSTSELKPVANFAGLQLSSKCTNTFSGEVSGAAAVLNPRDSTQLLLTVPATRTELTRPFLQTFDMRTSRHASRQALTRNNVTDFNLGPERTPILPPDVGQLAISHDGDWLATVDEWMPRASDLMHIVPGDDELKIEEERKNRREQHLKIWKLDESQQLWTLTTRIDSPHARSGVASSGSGRVITLVNDPRSTTFATLGEDSYVKIWKPKARQRHGVVLKDSQGAEVAEWTCSRMVELPLPAKRTDSPMHGSETHDHPLRGCLAYSPDGSMLVACTTHRGANELPVMHVIDAVTCKVLTSKVNGIPAGVAQLALIERYLLSTSFDTIHVWDLVTDSLRHKHHLPGIANPLRLPPLLCVNHADGTFAVARGTQIIIFKIDEQKLLYKTTCESPVAALLPNGRGYTVLCMDATIRTLDCSSGPSAIAPTLAASIAPVGTETEQKLGADEVTSRNLANLLEPAVMQDGSNAYLRRDDIEDDRPVVRPEHLAMIFDVGPSFAMPPVKDMFQSVVSLFSRKPVLQNARRVAS